MKVPTWWRSIRAGDIQFGPRIVSEFQRTREAEGRLWAEGYTQAELDSAQERFGLTFPPDLIALFLDRRPVQGWDWRSDDVHIRTMLEHPFEGPLFDIEHNGLWWPEWGERPALAGERAEVLRVVLREAPKLVPLLSHRYIPCEPHEAGNPVFSVHQADVIYYGADLEHYFQNEFGGWSHWEKPIKRIRFWSDLVDRAQQGEFYPGRPFR